jgi:AraC-like DNA-binding protein
MKYSITSNEIQSFYNTRYIRTFSDTSFCFTKDEIDTDILQMAINEWETPNLKAHLIRARAQKDTQIIVRITGKLVAFHFVCEEKNQTECNSRYPVSIKQNTNNWIITEGNVKHKFSKGQTITCFNVLFSHTYICAMKEQYPDTFGTLSVMLKRRCPVLQEGNLATTLEMKMVIEQIKNTSEMGALAPFYFETKIRELIALQMKQIDKLGCPECKYNKHYREQLNKVRNLIESRYKMPPTIAEIAQFVGMSETVLKVNFKNCFGTTIYRYLFNYRMSVAKNLLSDISMTIAEIGYKTGYNHPSHFTTAFKRKYGISPMEYRAKCT